MENSTEHHSETQISTSPSFDHVASILELLRVDSEKGKSIEAAGTFSQGNGSQHSPAIVSSNLNHKLGFELEQRYNRTRLRDSTPVTLPRYPRPSSIMTENFVGRPDWEWLYQNIFLPNIPFTSNSANHGNPFTKFPFFSNWVYQNGGSNSTTSLNGGAENLMPKSFSLNNGVSCESSLIDRSAATGNNEGYSVNGWNRSSGIYGDLRNGQSYNNDGQEWLERVDVFEQALNESGSKKLQAILAEKDESKTNLIFEKTLEGVLYIMTNKYGQFLFGRLIEYCNLSQLHMIVVKATSQVEVLIYLSYDRYGSQCLKKLIKVLEKSPLIAIVTSALSRGFFELMTNRTSSHTTILRCFEVLDWQQNEELYRKLIDLCLELASNETGCVSLNRAIYSIKGELRNELLYKISQNAAYLAQDPYGNYVIQVVIGLANPTFTSLICSNLKGLYVALSTMVGGSHVVERCLESKERHYAVQEFLNCDKLGHIAKNQFGNYVLQTALRETKRAGSPLHQVLLKRITSLSELHHGHGKNVLNFINHGIPLER